MLIARNIAKPGWSVTCGCGLNTVCLTYGAAKRLVRDHKHASTSTRRTAS